MRLPDMPTSHSAQLNEIVELIELANPSSVLDIGVGFGKFGFLAREYLELWGPEADYGRRRTRIDGIEAWAAYVTPLQRAIYDDILVGDATTVLPGVERRYDLVLLIDVLEHCSESDGLRVLQEVRRIGANLIISTPRGMAEQGAVFGNPFEQHRFEWSRHRLRRELTGWEVLVVPNERSLILMAGSAVPEVRRGRARRRRAGIVRRLRLLARRIPGLRSLYRAVRSGRPPRSGGIAR